MVQRHRNFTGFFGVLLRNGLLIDSQQFKQFVHGLVYMFAVVQSVVNIIYKLTKE